MREMLRGIRFMIGMSFKASPLLTIATFGITGIGAALVPAGFWATKLLVDAVTTRDEGDLVVAVVLLVGIRVFTQVALNYGLTTIRMNMEDRTRLHIDTTMLRLGADIPGIAHFERADFANEMELLRGQTGSLAQTAGPLVFLLQVVVTGVGTMALLASLHPLLLLVPVFGIPGVLCGSASARINQRAFDASAEDLRRIALLFGIATGPVPGKEVRIFGLAPELRRRLAEVQDETHATLTAARIRGALLTAAGSVLFAVAYVGAVALVGWRTVNGDATPGDLVLAVVAASTISGVVTAAVTNATWLTGTLRTIKRFIWLIDYAEAARPVIADPQPAPDRLTHGLDMEGVSFTYPSTDVEVLHHLDLHIPAGSTVAIVGDNGAGKTTLVKLLCRLYEPTTGTIRVDRVDLASIDHEDWRSRIAAGFQDFAKFEFLAREAVGVGDLTAIDDEAAVLDALERASASDVVRDLPAGLGTQLGRSFATGTDLSTGQWQKLALGRALMRESPLLLLLDEPTASLDAQTEHALFERYARSAAATSRRTGAITILVSHRFSTVRMASLILVVEHGRVTEVGDHEQLMAQDGAYAAMYNIQASAYR